ncbi:MAG: hypothetical protein ABR576_13980 [Thermoanaerobaculia bacterium]
MSAVEWTRDFAALSLRRSGLGDSLSGIDDTDEPGLESAVPPLATDRLLSRGRMLPPQKRCP